MTEFTCSKCDICLINNHHPLLGDGNLNANIMFIARNPSAFEIKNNIPLISKEGMLFQRYLDLFNFSRDDIYITNVVKCRTPSHRHPTDNEIYNCRGYLENEIISINPKIIVLVGNTALRSYFKLAFTNTFIDIATINSKYIAHNNRVILFMIDPSHAINSNENRIAIYHAFLSLLTLYRNINPGHTINFNL